jgi:hypothetical protein
MLKANIGDEIVLAMTPLALSMINLRVVANLSYGRAASLHRQAIDGIKHDYEVTQQMADFTFGFISVGKSCLDLFCCCLEAIVTRAPARNEWQMKDFRWLDSFPQSYPKVLAAISQFKTESWVTHLIECRNRLMHRGYFPRFEYMSDFERSDLSEEEKKVMFFQSQGDSFGKRDKLFTRIVRQDLSWGSSTTVLSDGAIRDGRGSVVRELDLDTLAKGFLRDFEKIDKQIADAIVCDGIVPGISDFEPIAMTYHGAGSGLMVHRTVGAF